MIVVVVERIGVSGDEPRPGTIEIEVFVERGVVEFAGEEAVVEGGSLVCIQQPHHSVLVVGYIMETCHTSADLRRAGELQM